MKYLVVYEVRKQGALGATYGMRFGPFSVTTPKQAIDSAFDAAHRQGFETFAPGTVFRNDDTGTGWTRVPLQEVIASMTAK
jgi:photosystem II stability/assembly factor-like uncharacterized protein